MSAEKSAEADGTGSVILLAVFVMLFVAKISGAADISWLYVTLPLWLPLAMLVAVLGFVGAFLLVGGAFAVVFVSLVAMFEAARSLVRGGGK